MPESKTNGHLAKPNGQKPSAQQKANRAKLTEKDLQDIEKDILEYSLTLGLDKKAAEITARIAIGTMPNCVKE